MGEDDQHLYNLNLPSIAIPSLKTTTSVYRTVTNVGKVNASYEAVIESPGGIEMFVQPSSLSFDERVRVHTFKVVFENKHQVQGDLLSFFKHSMSINCKYYFASNGTWLHSKVPCICSPSPAVD